MSKSAIFYYKNNRFQQLRGFYFAATIGNITKAAKILNLTQPSISLQIQALERDLGRKLFQRKGPAINLTADGKILLELVRPLLEGIDSLKENFETLTTKNNEEKLNIAANQATMLYLLPKLICKYTKQFPQMKVKIHAAVALTGIEKLRNGEVDIIVGPANFEIPEDFVYHPLFYYDPVLITRPEHPLAGMEGVTIKQMSKYHLILPPSHLRTITTMEQLFLHNNFSRTKVKLEFDGWEIIKKYVELDMAITIALDIAIEDDPILVGTKLNHYFPRSSYGIILRRGQVLTNNVKEFITTICPEGVELGIN